MTYGIDNSRPDDALYPTAPPIEDWGSGNLIVHVGAYVVNGDGDIVVATTSNAEPYPSDFLRYLNEGFFRARYLGCRDDYLEFANRCRHATIAEIEGAITYVRAGYAVTQKGQLALL